MAYQLTASPSASYHRDFRGDTLDYKRDKNISCKWAHGVRPAVTGGPHNRPRPVRTSLSFTPAYAHKQNEQNIVKFTRDNKPWMPAGRVRAHTEALVEIDFATRNPGVDPSSIKDVKDTKDVNFKEPSILYSYDNLSTPQAALPLEVFVKPATAKATSKLVEKLVEKEYEVLDDNGDAVRGRKARQVLRNRGPATVTAEPEPVVDGDYELI